MNQLDFTLLYQNRNKAEPIVSLSSKVRQSPIFVNQVLCISIVYVNAKILALTGRISFVKKILPTDNFAA